jgi:hypothetical protein
MNASATIRASYIRHERLSLAHQHPRPHSITDTTRDLEPRPAHDEKLNDITPVNHLEYREKCRVERTAPNLCFDLEKHANIHQTCVDNRPLDNDVNDDDDDDLNYPPIRVRLKKLFTTFPYRDPIYLVALIFLFGSIVLVLNATFELLPHLYPDTEFKHEETTAVPTTLLIGSILFFVAGILDTICALNIDAGRIESLSKLEGSKVVYKPALLGSRNFTWVPSFKKFARLTINSLAFQAGLIVLLGGVVFMFGGIVDFPGIIPEEDNPFFGLVVFGPQVVHGALFFVANVMLALSEQEKWYKLNIWHADWISAILNAVGGFGFMVAGLFLLEGAKTSAGVGALVGSCAFLVGSTVRMVVVMEVW